MYVIGVPAPFGRQETQMKWVDPDPKFDQTPQWGMVEQGPETLPPERIKLSFAGPRRTKSRSIRALVLTPHAAVLETGGIYFAVHPNRSVDRRSAGSKTAPIRPLRAFSIPK